MAYRLPEHPELVPQPPGPGAECMDVEGGDEAGKRSARWWSWPLRFPFWTLGVAAAIALGLNWPDYHQLLRAWLAGAVPADLTLWGYGLHWWERLGKVLQFVGGLTVILDFVDQQKLRERAAQLDKTMANLSMLRRRGAILATVEEREGWIRDELIHRSVIQTPSLVFSGSAVVTEYLNEGPIDEPPPDMLFGSTDVAELRSVFIGERHEECTCRKRHEKLCTDQKRLLNTLIAQTVARTLQPEEKEQLDHTLSDMRQNRARERLPRTLFLLVEAALIAAALAASARGSAWSLVYLGAFTVVAMIGLVVMTTESLQYAIAIAVRLRPAAAWRLLLAELLDQRRPGHRLRKLGFTLLIVGFQFDLLSS
ncbi:hypothetical protein [Actinoplanes sp. GCM10030250]|uniref:hypothetical protein n=1 Tax=Actinoplanes sp. GCM10030250 TaxID=3273376 RepID=UPI0036060CF6